MNKHDLTPRHFGLSVWVGVTALTIFLYAMVDIPTYQSRALPLIWLFDSWNFYAYAFDKRMWPWQFIELHGQGKGQPGWRAFWFWFSVVMYSIILGAIAWAY